MSDLIMNTPAGITLVGGGPVTRADLDIALAVAPVIVAADSGADWLLKQDVMPEAVIGDMDSLSSHSRRRIPAGRLHEFSEQLTTDFDKALNHLKARFILGLGFIGGRTDHGLSVLNTLVQQAGRPCLLLGPEDVIFAAPPRPVTLSLPPGERLSLFPLNVVRGRSKGLEWPIEGIDFSPGGRIGTSNRVIAENVTLCFDQVGMLVILPRERLRAAMAGFGLDWQPVRR